MPQDRAAVGFIVITTLGAGYIIFQCLTLMNEGNWRSYIFFIAAVSLFAFLAIRSVLSRAKQQSLLRLRKQMLIDQGVDVNNFINLGNYIGGHPDMNNFLTNVSAYNTGTDFDLYATFKDKRTSNVSIDKQASIPISRIMDIVVEDRTTVEKRLSIANIAVFGMLGLAMREKEVHSKAFLSIFWNDGRFDHETLFSLPGPAEANEVRNALIRECRDS